MKNCSQVMRSCEEYCLCQRNKHGFCQEQLVSAFNAGKRRFSHQIGDANKRLEGRMRVASCMRLGSKIRTSLQLNVAGPGRNSQPGAGREPKAVRASRFPQFQAPLPCLLRISCGFLAKLGTRCSPHKARQHNQWLQEPRFREARLLGC